MKVAIITFFVSCLMIAHCMAVAPSVDMSYNQTPANNWYANLLRKLKLIK